LEIKNGAKGFYLVHKVAPKEGLFPLGRMYNVHPRHIANFNGLDFNKGLAIGQLINIPLSDTNYKTTVDKGIPIYYKTTGGESFANISVKNKSQINKLREWNGIAGDNVPSETKLIVGFLITNEMQEKVVTITPKTSVVEESVSNVKKQETSEKKEPLPEVKKDVVVEESVSNVKKAEDLKKQIEEPKKDNPKTEPVVNKEAEIKKEEPPMVKEEPKKIEPVVIEKGARMEDGIGYFKNSFYQQVKTSPLTKDQTVTSSIFRTQSGWQDAKYYLLINGVEHGTIVKITNPSNSKTVYAKVLYSMDKIRANQGVDIRISDAAASSLAVSETDKFILKVNY
jgi:hypothetical protein